VEVSSRAENAVAEQQTEELDSLRALLLRVEHARIKDIENRLQGLEGYRGNRQQRVIDSSEVLADSIQLSQQSGDELAEALQPEVVRGIKDSIRSDPNTMAEALYPVLGPSVRKLIASMFSIENVRQNGAFRLEQIFLIHRETSLVLGHVLAKDAIAQDADMVSGMLDAIRSFVQDAFSAHEFDGLDSLQVGDVTVWVEWGPEAVLATVVRGLTKNSFRDNISDTLVGLHEEYAEELANFDGDTSVFESVEKRLQSLLDSQPAANLPAKGSRVSYRLLGCVALIGLVAWWLVGQINEGRLRDYVSILREQPGIVVISSNHRFGNYRIRGLLDPLAADPSSFLLGTKMDPDNVDAVWHPYQALDDSLVVKRATTVLDISITNEVSLDDGVLTVSGYAPKNWLVEANKFLPVLDGVDSIVLNPHLRNSP